MPGEAAADLYHHTSLCQGEEQDIREWPIPKECFNTDSGKLLEFVADCVEEMLVEHPPACVSWGC